MMLESIQQKMQGTGMKVFLAIIIIFFVFGGGMFTATMFNNDPNQVAEVNGVSISAAEVDTAVNRLRQQNPNFDQQYPTTASKTALREQIRERLINERLLTSTIEESGLTASAKQVQAKIRSYPEFQQNGVYSPELAKTLLAQNNMSVQGLENTAKKQVTQEQFEKAIRESGFTLDHEIETFYRLQEQTRDARVLRIPRAKFEQEVVIEPAAISDYYQANQALFEQAEKVNISYLVLSQSKLAEEFAATITEQDISAYYNDDNNKAEFIAPDQIRVAHILIAGDDSEAENKAADLLAQIKGGADFSELAKANSADAFSGEKGGELDATDAVAKSSGWVPEFEAAALALTEVNQVTDLVKTQYGFHIIKLLERTAGASKPLEQVSEEIKQRLAKTKADTAFYEKQALLSEALFSTETMADLAKTAGLPLQESGLFAQAEATGDLANPALLEQAFDPSAINAKDISDEIKLNDDAIAYLAVKEHQATGIKPLEAVSAEITASLKSEKIDANVKSFADQVKQDLSDNKAIDTILAEKELAWVDNAGFSYNDAALEPTLLQVLFKQKAPQDNQPVLEVAELVGGDYVVMELRKVNYPDMTKLDAAKKQQYKAQMDYFHAQTGLSDFIAELREKADIK